MKAARPFDFVFASALGAALACLALGEVANAQSADPAPAPADPDSSAIVSIVASSVTEVKLCDLALTRSNTREVRSFCRQLVDDHARSAIAGMALAQKIGAVDAKLEPLPEGSAAIDALEHDSGHAFDRAVLLEQIERHENDQDALRYASEMARDDAVKRYERIALGRAQKFLNLAETTLDSISGDQP